DLPKHGGVPLRDGPHDLGEEIGLGWEIAVDGSNRDLGQRGDGGDLSLPESAVGHELPGGPEDPRSVVRQSRLDSFSPPVGHEMKPNSLLSQKSESRFIFCQVAIWPGLKTDAATTARLHTASGPPGRRCPSCPASLP